MTRSCVVTGGAGFVGGFLIEAILRESLYDAVWVLDLERPAADDPRVRFVACDIREPIDVAIPPGCETLFHLAARAREPGYEDREYFETNHRGTVRVADLARRSGIRSIVYTSSMMVYGASEERMTEESLTVPDTAYGTSKLLGEWALRQWLAESADRRLRIVRAAVVFGRGEGNNFIRLFHALKRRRFLFVGRDSTIKSCIYVKDLVRLVLLCAGDGGDRLVYNAAYPRATSIREICEAICAEFGWKRRVPTVPYGVALLGARVASALGALGILPEGVHPRRIEKLYHSTNIAADAVAGLGFEPEFSLPAALRDWHRECGGGDLS